MRRTSLQTSWVIDLLRRAFNALDFGALASGTDVPGARALDLSRPHSRVARAFSSARIASRAWTPAPGRRVGPSWRGVHVAQPTPQYRREMSKAWDFIERSYRSDEILGEKAARAILALSARASHHELPFGLSFMAGLIACTNGAHVEVFPGSRSPLMLAVINVNYPQTRKSSGFHVLTQIGAAIDEASAERAAQAMTEVAAEELPERGADSRRRPPRAAVQSTMMSTFTEAAFFQRCAGDWDQIAQGPEHGVCGRMHYGVLVNLDESYKLLRTLGLIAAEKKNSDPNSVTDAASEFNRLVQTGTTSLATKTSGSFGSAGGPVVTMGLGGNAHPSVIVPMERGEVGPNHAAAKERLIFATGPPIEPHDPLPERLELPAGTPAWRWPKLLRCMVEPLGLPPGVTDPRVASEQLQEAPLEDATLEPRRDPLQAADAFAPHASGYLATFSDGSVSRLRFRRKVNPDGSHGSPQAEIRIANGDAPIGGGLGPASMARRVINYFSQPHMLIRWTEEAGLAFKGLSTVLNVNCACARDAGDVSKAARLGIGPWLLSMLAPSLLILELAVGEFDGTENLQERKLEVQEHHVVRANDLLDVLVAIRELWQEGNALLPSQVEDLARRAMAAPPPAGMGGLGFGEWCATQPAGLSPAAAPHASAPASTAMVSGRQQQRQQDHAQRRRQQQQQQQQQHPRFPGSASEALTPTLRVP